MVVVLSILVLSDVLLLVSQEMTARQKLEIRKMYKHFFIFSSIPKVKYYWLGEPNIYHDLGVFYKNRGILLGGLSDCEELVGVTWSVSDSVKN